MADGRIYAIKDKATAKTRLVFATSGPQALRHVALDTMQVWVPSTQEALNIAKDGVTVESAKAEPAP